VTVAISGDIFSSGGWGDHCAENHGLHDRHGLTHQRGDECRPLFDQIGVGGRERLLNFMQLLQHLLTFGGRNRRARNKASDGCGAKAEHWVSASQNARISDSAQVAGEFLEHLLHRQFCTERLAMKIRFLADRRGFSRGARC